MKYVAGILFAIQILLSACTQEVKTESTDESSEFPVTWVDTMDVVTDVLFVADINAVQFVEMRARINGYLEAILVDEGRTVEKGQLLFQINDQEYRAALQRAEANRKSAEAEYKSAQVESERVRMLVEKEVIAKTEMDLAAAKIDIAKAHIQQAKSDADAARIKLENTSIRAPFKGIINRIPFKLGSLISEGSLLTTIADESAVNVYFKVSEVDYLHYVRTHNNIADSINGSVVELILADGSTYSEKGVIETMESKFEEGTGSIALRARFPNPEKMLKHGSNGKIKVRRNLSQVVIIPQKSALEIQDKNYVFVVDSHGVAMMHSFDVFQRYKDYYLVRSGLEPGQRIVYEGVQNIREGSVIKTRVISREEVYKLK